MRIEPITPFITVGTPIKPPSHVDRSRVEGIQVKARLGVLFLFSWPPVGLLQQVKTAVSSLAPAARRRI